MNALIRKEIRLILPGWIGATILALVPVCLMPQSILIEILSGKDTGYVFVSVWFFLGLVFPALATFGHEFNFATFSALLSQPISRREIWRLKVGVLVAVNALVVAAFFGALLIRFSWLDPVQLGSMGPLMWSAVLFSGLAMSGGLWTTLLLRQTAAAFWLTLMVPGFLVVAILIGLALGLYRDINGELVSGFFIVYSVTGFVWARRLFYGAQDTGWLGQAVSLPRLTWRSARALRRAHHPVFALLRKEIQLQQMTFIIATAMALIHVLDLVARNLFVEAFPQCRNLLEVVPFLWLLLPVIAGSVAIAEERKIGTLEGQLCAPIWRGCQFAIKFAVVFCVGFFMGAIAPNLLEAIGRKSGVPGGVDMMVITSSYAGPSRVLLVASLAMTFVSFYASSLSRNTLQALGKTIIFACIFYVLVGLFSSPPVIEGRSLWGFPLANAIGAKVGLLTIIALAWINYGHLHFGARIWRQNVLTLVAALVATLIASSFVYNRAWEAWLPEEPNHPWIEKAKIKPVTVSELNERVAVVTADGRLWVKNKKAAYLPGDDWKMACLSWEQSYALKTNGSLWTIEGELKPFMSDTRWNQIVNDGEGIAGLRTDGTIWHWHKASPTHLDDLHQIGTNHDWVLLSGGLSSLTAAKADGTVVKLTPKTNNPTTWQTPPGRKIMAMVENSYLLALMEDTTLWVSKAGALKQLSPDAGWIYIQRVSPWVFAALKQNGTVWLIRQAPYPSLTPFVEEQLSAYPTWVGISEGSFGAIHDYSYNTMLALAADGKLCRWHVPDNERLFPEEMARPYYWMAQSRLRAVTVANLDLKSN